MANDFKAAAERKKRMAEMRKAQKLISQMEGILEEHAAKLSPEDVENLRSAVDVLNTITAESAAEVEVLMGGNEAAQKVVDAISEKLSAQEEAPVNEAGRKDAPVTETEPEEVPEKAPEVVTEEAPAVPEVTSEASNAAEETVGDIAEDVQKEDPDDGEETIAQALRRLYDAPRYSRMDGETRTRFSALIKPSLKEKMKKDQEAGNIKSPNDLINALLEIFYEED